MRISCFSKRLSLAVFVVAWCRLATATVGAVPSTMEELHEAILNDIIQSYPTHEPTQCNTPEQAAATSFSFTWPGNITSMKNAFVPFEQGFFQAIMRHNDTGNRSWSIRIGTGGNVYSHIYQNAHGETVPPQENDHAPWIDEVRQSVAAHRYLNKNGNCIIHQAGAYQRDSTYTTTPFHSPSLAKHCKGNSCTFASWGTQAHVPNNFTSPIIFISKYTNCGNGIIEHTQIIHK